MSAPFSEQVKEQARIEPHHPAVDAGSVPQLEAAVRQDLNALVLPVLRSQGHARWLDRTVTQLATVGGNLGVDLSAQWRRHEATAALPEFAHYRAFDRYFGGAQLVWRFTSNPSSEIVRVADVVQTTPDPTGILTILRVIAAHSGGNDKSAPDVQTLSFARNPAALIGTACSSGGDPHVQDIVEKAAYLVGIDVSTLADRGVSAHPALGRAISMFETEYVLVSTPGTQNTLKDLASVISPNPLTAVPTAVFAAARQEKDAAANRREIITAENKRLNRTVVVEKIPQNELQLVPPQLIPQIQAAAIASTKAAQQFAGIIRSTMTGQGQQTDNYDYPVMARAILNYINGMRSAGAPI